jgi:hypothetical protein
MGTGGFVLVSFLFIRLFHFILQTRLAKLETLLFNEGNLIWFWDSRCAFSREKCLISFFT